MRASSPTRIALARMAGSYSRIHRDLPGFYP